MAEKPQALTVGVLHGPNLNLLGQREPEIYGAVNLADIDSRLAGLAAELGAGVESFQSNSEADLVTWIQDGAERFDGLLVNAAAYTHTSLALRDALLAVELPFVEVHLSNIFAREPVRRQSYLADVALAFVAGFGPESYLLALRGLIGYLRRA